jgi:hypothetical protein
MGKLVRQVVSSATGLEFETLEFFIFHNLFNNTSNWVRVTPKF